MKDQTMQTSPERTSLGLRFFVGWVVLSAVSASVGLLMAGFWYVLTLYGDLSTPVECLIVPFALLLGIAGGSGQALVLARVSPIARRWVLASVIGSVAAMVAITLLNNGPLNGLANIGGLVDAAIFGTIVGMCQWFIVRHVRWAAIWVAASAIGFVVGMGSTAIAFGNQALVLFAPLPYSVITGFALLALVRYSSLGAPPLPADADAKVPKRHSKRSGPTHMR
jgi:hypothetical protein